MRRYINASMLSKYSEHLLEPQVNFRMLRMTFLSFIFLFSTPEFKSLSCILMSWLLAWTSSHPCTVSSLSSSINDIHITSFKVSLVLTDGCGRVLSASDIALISLQLLFASISMHDESLICLCADAHIFRKQSKSFNFLTQLRDTFVDLSLLLTWK